MQMRGVEMQEIGGYIELDTYNLPMYHEEAIALNCGRNCLAYLFETKKIKKICLPYFLCNSIRDVCEKYGISIRYYHINADFTPVDIEIDSDEWFYMVNYYGQVKRDVIENLAKRYERFILDQAQAYFEDPIENGHTLYTCRKFFGVPDGAFLYTDSILKRTLPIDVSNKRMKFLLGRFEESASNYYSEYVANNEFFVNDDVQFIKGGWINRNRILVNGKPSFINLNIKKDSTYKNINERFLVDNIDFFKQKLLKTIKNSYSRAPFFNEGYTLFQHVLENKEMCISTFLFNSFIEIADALEIRTKFILSSNLNIDNKENRLEKENRIYRIMDLLQSSYYINPLGGHKLYFKENFQEEHKQLFFIKTNDIKYQQFSNEFVSNLSIIDVIMFNGMKGTQSFLNQYSLV